jgi:hypothetical protein
VAAVEGTLVTTQIFFTANLQSNLIAASFTVDLDGQFGGRHRPPTVAQKAI